MSVDQATEIRRWAAAFDALPEYRPDEMIPLPQERVVAECGGSVSRVFEAHAQDIRGVPREIAQEAGFITHAVQEAQRKGWTACRRRDRYLILAVPSHVRES